MAWLASTPVFGYSSSTWENQMNEGARLLAQKEVTRAETTFKAALLEAGKQQGPGRESKQILALLALGSLYEKTGNNAAAEANFKRVSVIDKEDSESLTRLEKLYTKLRRNDEAARMKSLAAERDKLYERVDYSQFLDSLHRTLTQNWYPTKGKDRRAIVRFILNRKGDIEALCIAESSGDQQMDDSAFQAVADSEPFAVPKDGQERVPVLFTFNYNTERPEVFREKEEKRLSAQLTDMESQLGANNPALAFYMCQLGDAYRSSKKFDKAEQMYLKARQIVKGNSKALAIYMNVLTSLIALSYDSGGEKEAIRYIHAAADVADKLQKDTTDPEQTARVFHTLGKLLYKMNRTADGDTMFARERALQKPKSTFH